MIALTPLWSWVLLLAVLVAGGAGGIALGGLLTRGFRQ